MRRRIFEIIEVAKGNDKLSGTYDVIMTVIIILSLVPLTFKETTNTLLVIEYICVVVFVIDYFVRWFTADFKLCRSKVSFVLYPFTIWAIIDLLAILPSFNILSTSFKVLKVFRGFRMFRIAKFLKYSKSFAVIIDVVSKSKQILFSLVVCAIIYVLVSALFMFNAEPETFDNFFESIYWATTALTTVGYGDIYPVSHFGRIVSMVSSFVGIGFVALPSGVLTAQFLEEFRK